MWSLIPIFKHFLWLSNKVQIKLHLFAPCLHVTAAFYRGNSAVICSLKASWQHQAEWNAQRCCSTRRLSSTQTIKPKVKSTKTTCYSDPVRVTPFWLSCVQHISPQYPVCVCVCQCVFSVCQCVSSLVHLSRFWFIWAGSGVLVHLSGFWSSGYLSRFWSMAVA